MFGLSLHDPRVIGTIAGAVVCIGGVTTWFILRRRPTAEEIERERRAQLVRSGRIMDGTILDITELETPGEPEHPREIRFILYKYEIGGVAYECSQEVTALRDFVNPAELRLGFPCSVRYDIHRPENSIVVAENWSGLRTTAESVPTRAMPQRSNPHASAPVQ
jgi:Protein of unknown function (DUF3592)